MKVGLFRVPNRNKKNGTLLFCCWSPCISETREGIELKFQTVYRNSTLLLTNECFDSPKKNQNRALFH